MILIFLPDNTILQAFVGFGTVTTSDGTLHIDGRDTTTRAADVNWKFVADQTLERDEIGNYTHLADYYEAFEPLPTAESRLAAIEMYLLEQELGL